MTALFSSTGWRLPAAILVSAILSALYARGGAGWVLGFVALVPWLRSLDAMRTLAGALLGAYFMAVAFTAAAFGWFGAAIGSYTQIGAPAGVAVLILAAPLFQPQFFAFALVRHLVGQRHGWALRTLAGAAAWVATEWLVPKMLGDTWGYGLYPSRVLRQAADLGGTAGLTVLLLLVNEGIAAALALRSQGAGARAMARPLALAAGVPLLLAAYGFAIVSAAPPAASSSLRIGLIQSNIVEYERQREERGAYAVVRDVLDTHFAMSYDAVARHHVDAVLWSETSYPTTFGRPKSEAGAEFDSEIRDFIKSAGVPFVFGTYDRDASGEYNAAAFVEPRTGLLGHYHKTRLFPLTEYVPSWLDGSMLRRWLPWTGSWKAGDGARVFPLRLADGREIPVQALICLDDMDTRLAIDGARLGALAILTMSNDSWFTSYPQGAAMHQMAAAFRSIETRLPQYRVTTNGYSALIDATGTVLADARMGERTLVIADAPIASPPPTLMVRWGDWVGLVATVFLALMAATAASSAWGRRHMQQAAQPGAALTWPTQVKVLSPGVRLAAGLLRAFARTSLLVMGAAMLLNDGFRANSFAQIRVFASFFLAPEAAAWFLLLAFAARASVDKGMLVLTRGTRRLELALRDIAAIEPWRLPLPGPGVSLRLVSGERWRYGLAFAHPAALAHALASAGAGQVLKDRSRHAAAYATTVEEIGRSRLDNAAVKFIALPFMLAMAAFRLHQHITYGSGLGEYHSFGLKAYLMSFSLWWAGWIIGVVLCAAALRAAIEIGTLLAVLLHPDQAITARRWLERLGRATLYLGLPGWLILRIFGA